MVQLVSPAVTKSSFLQVEHGLRPRRNTVIRLSKQDTYEDCSTIDWGREYAKDRLRKLSAVGALARFQEAALPWVVIAGTGICVGLLAGYLDILTLWLSDLRQGVCPSDWHLSRDMCCAGLDPGELCYSWVPWNEYFSLRSSGARAIAAYGVYLSLSVLFATCSAILVQTYAPQAFHTGIPEIKSILNGYILQNFLSGWTLVIKALGLSLSVASGLSLGKEGPLVHVACCVGSILSSWTGVFRNNEARRREILSAAAAAGVSVAFGAPLGGVLFSLEEMSSFFAENVLWQSFVCAIVAAFVLSLVDPYGTGRLVLFQVTASQVWRGFELIPFVFLGVIGGVFGHYFIRLNIAYAKFRSAELSRKPILEVAVVALLSALVSYLIIYAKVPTSEMVEALFSDCSDDVYGLCDREHEMHVVFLLLITALAKTVMTAVTFGIRVPAGIFLPSIAIGSCLGRAVGIIVSRFQQAYPLFFLFSSCPADGPCVSPSIYAVIGAAAVLGGVTRMTISLIVVFFELTGAITSVLSIMIAVMVSKFVGDFLARDGIYESWIKFRSYPFLDPKIDYRRDALTATDIMTYGENIVSIPRSGLTVEEVESLLQQHRYRGFPIVEGPSKLKLCGYVLRGDLVNGLVESRMRPNTFSTTRCNFIQAETEQDFHGASEMAGMLDLSPYVDEAPMTMSANSATEIVVQLFQRMGLRYLILTDRGQLAGILTKTDVFNHINEDRMPSAKADFLRRQKGLRDLESQDEPNFVEGDLSGQNGIDDSLDADTIALLLPSREGVAVS